MDIRKRLGIMPQNLEHVHVQQRDMDRNKDRQIKREGEGEEGRRREVSELF